MWIGPYHLKRAIPLLAAFSLVLHALLLGSFASNAHAHAAMPPAQAHVDCPEHDSAQAPADHQQKHDLRFCCILCGKLGTVVGPTPGVASLPALRLIVSTITFDHDGPALGRATSVLPVGARAPPRLV